MKVSLVSIPVQDPIKAHEIYTAKLGFVSKEFDPDASLAIVASAEDEAGTSLLLEPCLGTFVEGYQKSAFDSNLPVMVFESKDAGAEISRLKEAGVVIRPDLDRPEWGLTNLFEDGCGNLLMIAESQ